VLSFTVTVKLQLVLLFPQASLAVQVTVVTPWPKVAPLVGLQVTVGLASQLSVAVGAVKFTTAPLVPVHALVMLFGQALSVGAMVSSTVTVWLQVAEWLPVASVKSQVRVAE
jgi:hypothetical protein